MKSDITKKAIAANIEALGEMLTAATDRIAEADAGHPPGRAEPGHRARCSISTKPGRRTRALPRRASPCTGPGGEP